MLFVFGVLLSIFLAYALIADVGGIDGVIDVFMLVLIAVCGIFVTGLIVVFLAFIPGYKYELSKVENISALEDNSTVKGHSYLGSGYVDEELKYYYMVSEKGGRKFDYAAADHAVIYEGYKKARVETYKPVFKSKLAKILFFSKETPHENQYKFYVPKDSVTNEYNVDLK